MADLFKDKAADWDARPLPAQISQGVFDALKRSVALSSEQTVMDFGAGTGLICTKLAPLVDRVLAVDISEAMLTTLAQKREHHEGNVEIFCQDILAEPLGREVDLVVSAMAMHHIEDTRALLNTLREHLTVGGQLAIADLDTEEGDFHPPETEGVFHAGFDRGMLGALLEEVGFTEPRFMTACEVEKNAKRYPIFLVTAARAR
ncbi:MAG: class I SAM-dependent methyltransferase [Myxococcota bacterium]